jgi:hypothetical protein
MINLEGLLTTIESDKTITVNLYNSSDLLLITFGLPGYDSLDDELLELPVRKIRITNATNISVYLGTSI